MKAAVVFVKTKDGEIEMFRQVESNIAQEGRDWLESMRNFGNRLIKTLSDLKAGDRLVLWCEVKESPRGKNMA